MSSAVDGGPRVVVVGGGVIGLSCAYYLVRGGARVTVLERERVGAGASSGNAGTVSAGHPPLNKPGLVARALRWMLDPTSPLYVRAGWDPDLWRWLWTFARHCTPEHVRAAMAVMAPLGHDSLACFDRLIEEEHIDCGYRRGGYYDVCATAAGLAEAGHEAELIARHGYHPEALGPEELRREEPALAPSVVGGVYYPEAATLDPARFLLGLADRVERHGACIRVGAEVEEVVVAAGRAVGVRVRGAGGATTSVEPADEVVLATGPFSLRIARRLGLRLPVQPGKGYHRDLAVGPGGAPALRIACVLHESSVFCTPMDGFVRFAGTMEFSGENRVMRGPRLEQLTHAARAAFPALGSDPPLSEWCGLRPMAADGLPIVGPFPGVEGLSVATGHGMLGLTLGPATGSLVARNVLEGERGPVLEGLSPGRFG